MAKTAATEDEVGLLHKGITRAFSLKVGHMLKKFDKAIEMEEEDEELADQMKMLAIDDRSLSAASKWVQANNVTCAMPEDEEGSELGKKLKAMKARQSGKVIDFKEAK